MKPSSNEQIEVNKKHLNNDLLDIVKSFVDYFESIDQEITQDEAIERKM